MSYLWIALGVVKQYEQGVLFRLGEVTAVRRAGLTVIVPFADVLNRVSLRTVTMPIRSPPSPTSAGPAPSRSRPR